MKITTHISILLLAAAFAASSTSPSNAASGGPRFEIDNPNSIAIPLEGAAIPFPSVIQVSHVPGLVTKVTVTLSDLNDSFPEDLQIWLKSPSGQIAGLLINEGGTDTVKDATITFDDDAAAVIPDPMVSGVFKPTVNGEFITDPGLFNTLSSFNGENPNGPWSLFVVNRVTAGEPTGDCLCGGWSLEIKTDPSHGKGHRD
jgi:hypothetical protein